MADPDRLQDITRFLNTSGWVESPFSVSFLAAGEYNANWRVETPQGTRVLRINHGSQLGLGDRQIAYEYQVLEALANSGVTPRPLACHPNPGPLDGGAMLMEFLPGKPLDYRQDLDKAAHIFSRVHAVPAPDTLIIQADPVMDIARESTGLLQRFPAHPLEQEKALILAYRDEVTTLADQTRDLFKTEEMCIVNTEVNSGNFLIGDAGAFLVDWEKAVVSYRYQDLGHFMVPTTTLWKTDVRLTPEDRQRFLTAYHRAACPEMDIDEMIRKTQVMERAILLRALSWCFMAWYEYTRQDRALQNRDTFLKIEQYLSDIPWILNSAT
ncbi:MAG: aminoglycoside phosphotransferase family protein [Desulfobacter sp.]